MLGVRVGMRNEPQQKNENRLVRIIRHQLSHRSPEPGCRYRRETGDHPGMVGGARDPIRDLSVGVGGGRNRFR